MSSSLSAALSAKWLVLTQVLLAVLQFGYGAVTARVFLPEQFGSFIAATSIQSLLVLAATTGIPSYALAQKSITRRGKRHLRIWAQLGGAVAALAYWVIAPHWFNLMNAADEMDFRYIMALGCFVLPAASLESAFMRRNRNGRQDALVIFFGFAAGAAIALTVVLLLREVWALSLQPLVTATITTILCSVLQSTESSQLARETSQKRFLRHGSLVTVQNLFYYVFQQAPGWLVGIIGGSAALGTYSRAYTLAGTPGTGIATGINRAVQPRWSRIDANERDRALVDTVIIAGALGFPLFGGLIVIGGPIVTLWLGPGWEETIPLTRVLAVGFGLHLVLAVLTSNAEMLGMHGLIRKVQGCMAATLGATIGIGALIDSPLLIAASVATTNLAGLIAIVAFREWQQAVLRALLVRQITRAGLITVLVVGTCTLLLLVLPPSGNPLVRLAWSTFAYVSIWAAASNLYRVGPTLASRGVRMPRFIYS